MEMNFASNYPQSMYSFHMLAQARIANQELGKAKQDYRKVLEVSSRGYLGKGKARHPLSPQVGLCF